MYPCAWLLHAALFALTAWTAADIRFELLGVVSKDERRVENVLRLEEVFDCLPAARRCLTRNDIKSHTGSDTVFGTRLSSGDLLATFLRLSCDLLATFL